MGGSGDQTSNQRGESRRHLRGIIIFLPRFEKLLDCQDIVIYPTGTGVAGPTYSAFRFDLYSLGG